MTADPGRVELAPGYEISRLIVGGWQLSAGHHRHGPGADEAVERLVTMADMGYDTFDCADIYTGVEELYGRFLRAWRSTSGGDRPIRIHTKLVPDLSALHEVDDAYVRGIVERSLTRLGLERLDLVQFYWWDTAVGDWLAAAGTLADLQREGKVRHVGVTNMTADEIDALEEGAGVSVVSNQVQYSLLDRRPESGVADRVPILAFGALAGGFLTGTWVGADEPAEELPNRSLVKYRLIIDEFGGWSAYQDLLADLADIAEAHGTDVPALALRWVLDRSGVAAALVGFSSTERMRSNRSALGLELTAEDHTRIGLHLEAARGPEGDVFGLERDRAGPHGRIMKYDLNAG